MNDKRKKTDFNRLLRKFQITRDDRFLNMFFHRIEGTVFRHFLFRNVKREQIEDAFQNAAMKLIRYPDYWNKNKKKAMSFFFMLVKQALHADWLKLQRRQRLGPTYNFSDLTLPKKVRGDTLESILNITAREENGTLLDAEERQQVRGLVCELPAEKFQIAAGICFEELRPAQIAQNLGITRQGVEYHLKSLKPHFSKLPLSNRFLVPKRCNSRNRI